MGTFYGCQLPAHILSIACPPPPPTHPTQEYGRSEPETFQFPLFFSKHQKVCFVRNSFCCSHLFLREASAHSFPESHVPEGRCLKRRNLKIWGCLSLFSPGDLGAARSRHFIDLSPLPLIHANCTSVAKQSYYHVN